MKWLLWREYRFSRVVLIAGAVMLLLPYAFALTVVCWPWRPDNMRDPDVFGVFFAAAIYSLGMSQVTVALLGGNAMAGERADHSAEFLAYLPLSRPRRLAAKLCLAACAVALLWVVNLPVLLTPLCIAPEESRIFAFIPRFLGHSAITGLTFFGVAWLISSLQSSPTFAVCGGLMTPLVLLMGLQAAAEWRDAGPSTQEFIGVGYAIIAPIVAVVCFSIGTWYFLRRVEP